MIAVAGLALEHAARPEALAEVRVLRIVGILRLLFSIEVIEVAEEFIEAMHGRQMFVSVAQMIFAELAGGIAECLHDIGHGRIERAKPEFGTR